MFDLNSQQHFYRFAVQLCLQSCYNRDKVLLLELLILPKSPSVFHAQVIYQWAAISATDLDLERFHLIWSNWSVNQCCQFLFMTFRRVDDMVHFKNVFSWKKKGCMYELNKLQVVKVWLPDIFCKFLNPYFCWNGVHLKQAAILFMFFKIYIFFYILSFAETSKWKTSCWTKRNLTSRLWVSLNVSLHRFRTWFCHLVTYYLECIISIAMTLPRFP